MGEVLFRIEGARRGSSGVAVGFDGEDGIGRIGGRGNGGIGGFEGFDGG